MLYKLKRFFWKALPLFFISKIMGALARRKVSRYFIKPYVKYFGVDLRPIPKKITDFPNLHSFFIREIDLKHRPVAAKETELCSPVDGIILNQGLLERGTLLSAKGQHYFCQELLGSIGPHYKSFEQGSYITLYLSPRDYHRIHAPLAGKVLASAYLPGYLYPVRPGLYKLFSKLLIENERVVTYFETRYGLMALVKVGALNVGSIQLSYEQRISCQSRLQKSCSVYKKELYLNKGEEVGYFELGSTVVALFNFKVAWFKLSGEQVLMGEALGDVDFL
ncbi:MAG: phosphatidylserine decarboxylase [Bacillota bacterium]|jgi:phosphatidylserine decarboxylase